MNLTSILRACCPDIWDSKIRLVRHADQRWDLKEMIRRGFFGPYESHQEKPKFHGIDYLLTFLGERGSRSRFLGCKRILSEHNEPRPPGPDYPYPDMTFGPYWYDLETVAGFEDLEDRLVIDWGTGTRTWVQEFPPKTPKRVIEILPRGHVRDFPGYDDVILSFEELARLVGNPDANRSWHLALKAVAGIYLITDLKRGNQYIGSASGSEGLLARWSSYASTKHGGNKELKELVESHPEAHLDFQFSILRTLPLTMTPKEVVAMESIYKQKLGTREHGLNAN